MHPSFYAGFEKQAASKLSVGRQAMNKVRGWGRSLEGWGAGQAAKTTQQGGEALTRGIGQAANAAGGFIKRNPIASTAMGTGAAALGTHAVLGGGGKDNG